MDLNLVFAKTQAGEQAVQERTRLVQRNLRNVLIMVDGRSTVQVLCDKVGKANVVESALEHLERDGYIQRLAEPGVLADSASSNATEAPAIAFEEVVSGQEVPETVDESLPGFELEPISSRPPESAVSVSAPSPVADSLIAESAQNRFAAPAEPSPFAIPVAAKAASSPFEAPSPFTAPSSLSPPPAKTEKASAGLLQRLFKRGERKSSSDLAPVVDVPRPERGEADPLRRGLQSRTSPYRWVGVGAAALVGVLLIAIFAFPYGMYQADLEADLSKALGQPVKIGAVHGSLSPLPVLVLERVQIGEAGELTIAEVRAALTTGSIFGGPRVYRDVALVGVRMPVERMSAYVPGALRMAQGDSFSVRHMTISSAALIIGSFELGNLSGTIEAAEDGKESRLRLRSSDETLQFDFVPGENGLTALLEASNVKAVVGTPFVWDTVAVRGTLSGASFVGDKLEGRVLDGAATGQMRFDWNQAGVALRANFGVDRASAKRLGEVVKLAAGLSLDGELNGKFRVTAAADQIAVLSDRATLEGEFVMRRATIGGLDFAEAVRRGGKTSTQGGSTPFEQISGNWKRDGRLLRIGSLNGDSGALHVAGSLMVDDAQRVAGSFDVRIKGSATEVRMPVSLSGTTKSPLLQGGLR